ncbi:hypothetical protein FBUS_11180 [Fasciolopsis buskii]|uniref:Uncharacterized protein n=1 Tax=Fasciolopsis buskii TaxID=27845 RepID=A0A8E0VPD0_9TREM|nr:hypothetical protein FBUS_11180 [Fasciolopsis buski]
MAEEIVQPTMPLRTVKHTSGRSPLHPIRFIAQVMIPMIPLLKTLI